MLTVEQRLYFDNMDEAKANYPVSIHPYDPKTRVVAENEMLRIKSIFQDLEIRFLGASALYIAGRNDVDLYVCETSQRSKIELLKSIGEIYGFEAKRDKWKLIRDGIEVTVKVIDPCDPKRVEQLLIQDTFLNDPDLLASYERLKWNLNGKTYREYSMAKLDFLMRLVTVRSKENQRNIQTLQEIGAMTDHDHVVTPNKRHSKMSFARNKLLPHRELMLVVADSISQRFEDDEIEAVVGLATGGEELSYLVAKRLRAVTSYKNSVMNFIAYKGDDELIIRDEMDKGVIRERRILLVDDTLKTGDSAKKASRLIDSLGGIVVGMGVICSRNCFTSYELGLGKFYSFVYCDDNLYSYPPEKCPMCNRSEPISQVFGIRTL